MNPGLCGACAHARIVRHPRGAADYWRCGLADSDPAFPKYPPLPVRACNGHKPGTPTKREASS